VASPDGLAYNLAVKSRSERGGSVRKGMLDGRRLDVELGMLGGDGAVWQQRPSADQFRSGGTKGVGVYRQQVPVVVFWRLSEADQIGSC
jgi:hypothetical protein